MKKEYYNEQKANYIQEKLSLSSIDKVYHPLIIDIMLRRQFEYELDDKFFNRDLDTFLNNVRKITVGILPEEELGEYNQLMKKITISQNLFEQEEIDFEKIYEILTHETVHAMRFEKVKRGRKQDRTFPDTLKDKKTDIMEVFTECEADALVYNKEYIDAENRIQLNETTGYSDITPYIHLIAATFRTWNKTITR